MNGDFRQDFSKKAFLSLGPEGEEAARMEK